MDLSTTYFLPTLLTSSKIEEGFFEHLIHEKQQQRTYLATDH